LSSRSNVERGDTETHAAYAEAGTSWWLENIHDRRRTFDEMRTLVRYGPG
jgi:hypothetical protein